MKNGGKKGIIMAAILIILIVILAAGGVFAYFTTDLFKSNQTLFFKYIGQAIEDFDYVENTQMKEIAKKKEEMPYTLEGTLQYIVDRENEDSININIDALVNKPEEKAYAKANLSYQNQDLFHVEYANSNDIYALKSDEIITAFLGIENNNLKVLAQKLGILDTTAIPDSINPINLQDLLIISPEEKQHCKQTYLPVLIDTISKDHFKKEKDVPISQKGSNYVTTAYHLELSEEELKQVVVALLETLKEDSITLNLITTKAKLLGLDENYTQINLLTNKIQSLINSIQNKRTLEEEGLLNIIVYTAKGEVITTEVVLKDNAKYTISSKTQGNGTNRYLFIENLNDQVEYNKIEINLDETRKDTETAYDTLINIDNKIGIDIHMENIGTAEEETLQTKGEVNINQEEKTATIYYNQEIMFKEEIEDSIELDRNNCGVLNDYTTEQLQPLLQAVGQRTLDVISQKLQTIMSSMTRQVMSQVDNGAEGFENSNSQQENNVFNETQERIQSIQNAI